MGKLNQLDKALDICNKAIQAEPNVALHFVSRGRIYVQRLDPQKALSDFTRAIELDRRNYYAYFNRAKVYVSRFEFEKAVEDLDIAVEIWPRPATVQWRDQLKAALEGKKSAEGPTES